MVAEEKIVRCLERILSSPKKRRSSRNEMKYSESQTKSLPNNEQLANGLNFTVFLEIQKAAYQ